MRGEERRDGRKGRVGVGESAEVGSSCRGFPPTDVFPPPFFPLFFYRNIIVLDSLPVPCQYQHYTFTSNGPAAADPPSHVPPLSLAAKPLLLIGTNPTPEE